MKTSSRLNKSLDTFRPILLIALIVSASSCEKKATVESPEEVTPTTLDLTSWVASEHPGSPKAPPDLAKKLAAAVEKKAANKGTFRTKHLEENGRPRFTNRLALEASPYLQQHAHNPVNWYPWGQEAFDVAAAAGLPVFLSVGYSTCHWCHVMEEESFEDLEIAEVLNTRYVAIKVDREERPDVDEIYMTAVRMLAGRGGWPMSVWLTSDRVPFAGGTYFPPRTGSRGSRVGFLELLNRHADAFRDDPTTIAKAQELAATLAKEMEASRAAEIREIRSPLNNAFYAYQRSFDTASAGWGNANKFPQPARLRFLLRYGSEPAMSMVTKTLDAMWQGGIYDQVGGGFHRYTVDTRWTVPHFEKMLYDNGQLITLYSEAYQRTGDENYRRVVEETITYLLRDMRSDDGELYAATDADSGGEEGTYFVWNQAQLNNTLGERDGALAARLFGVTATGNFEGKQTVLTRRSGSEPAIRGELNLDEAAFQTWIDGTREALFKARELREKPHRDDKIITAWNGLALRGFAVAGRTFSNDAWLDAARNIARGILSTRRDGALLRSRVGESLGPLAFSDDYAFAIAGLLALYQSTFELEWLNAAVELQTQMDRRFWDATDGGYYRTDQTSGGSDFLLANEKPFADGAVPSPNAVAASNLGLLHHWFPEGTYGERRDRLFVAFGQTLQTRSAAMPSMLVAVDFASSRVNEVVVVVPDEHQGPVALEEELRRFYPHSVSIVVRASDVDKVGETVTWVKGKRVGKDGKPTGYVCFEQICKLPTSDVATFRALLTGE